MEKYPSWPKGHPWKGCRSLIAARGFKSPLLRSEEDCRSSPFFKRRKALGLQLRLTIMDVQDFVKGKKHRMRSPGLAISSGRDCLKSKKRETRSLRLDIQAW